VLAHLKAMQCQIILDESESFPGGTEWVQLIAAGLLVEPSPLHGPEHLADRSRIVSRRDDVGFRARHRDVPGLEVWATEEAAARDLAHACVAAIRSLTARGVQVTRPQAPIPASSHALRVAPSVQRHPHA
jgi:hypothetical protein